MCSGTARRHLNSSTRLPTARWRTNCSIATTSRVRDRGTGRPWSFDGDGALFRLVSEAQRIRLAHLFDPVLAVHTSVVEPLPHQITAVYEAMLPRQHPYDMIGVAASLNGPTTRKLEATLSNSLLRSRPNGNSRQSRCRAISPGNGRERRTLAVHCRGVTPTR
jgi:hypothetical protein